MLSAILFSIIGLSFNVVGVPTYDLITPTPPLANVSSLLCDPGDSCGGTTTSAPVQTVSCENGTCSINRSDVAPPSTTRQPTYQKDVRYIGRHYQPVRRGLFGRKSSCRGGQCGQ